MSFIIIIIVIIVGYVIFIEISKALQPNHTKLFRRIFESATLGKWEKCREHEEELLHLFGINVTADGKVEDVQLTQENITHLMLRAHEHDIQYKGMQKRLEALGHFNKMADEVVRILTKKFHEFEIVEFDNHITRVNSYLTPDVAAFMIKTTNSMPVLIKKISEDLRNTEEAR